MASGIPQTFAFASDGRFDCVERWYETARHGMHCRVTAAFSPTRTQTLNYGTLPRTAMSKPRNAAQG